MEKRISLSGEWELHYYDAVKEPDKDWQEAEWVPAQVPGNAELDLVRAGLLPENLFQGMNIRKTEEYEPYDWVYVRSFDTPDIIPGEEVYLCFEGVDCVADYWLNDKPVFCSQNAFIPQEFRVTELLNPNGENQLRVHIHSALLENLSYPYETYENYAWHLQGAVHLRKPAHSFGWDIFPRAVSAGIWKDAFLCIRDGFEIEDISYVVTDANEDAANVTFRYSIAAPAKEYLDGKLEVRISGRCGDSSFSGSDWLYRRKIGRQNFTIRDPKLWWPYGYGDSPIYDTVIELLRDGRVLASKTFNVGLRTLELRHTELLSDPEASFCFVVNGVDILAKGSNWVPLDAFHSRDKERYAKAMELVSDIGCNILRVWGGGVYEQDVFYDYCDRHGIMVWQDFMMACAVYPMDEEMMAELEQEFTWVIRTHRLHPSIVLWAGDNEIDEAMASTGINPGMNDITRKLLPSIVARYDYARPYLPSSPYLTERAYKEYRKGNDVFVERHLWGARDYYKAEFYSQSKACFVSETGYHGCPNVESVHKIVDEDAVWPFDNEQWTLHSSDQNNNPGRVRLMADQIDQLFRFKPDNLEDFVLASQISQAEAKKYFIERIRLGRPHTGGVIWWNLLDGWPQFSDAVVDYFYSKKLAYSFIQRAQAPFVLAMKELKNWCYTLTACNDTRETKTGTYKVSDIETGEVLAEGSFHVDENQIADIAKIRLMYSDQRMLLIEWNVGGKVSYNHYLCGYPAFKFEDYKRWLGKLQAIAD